MSERDATYLLIQRGTNLQPAILAHKSEQMSPAVGLATALLKLGNNGLRQVERALHSDTQGIDRNTPQDLYQIAQDRSETLYHQLAINHAAVAIGALIPEIESAIVDGVFHVDNIAGRYNEGIRNSGMFEWNPKSSYVIMGDEAAKQLRKLAQEDPSLLSLLAADELPEEARKFLRDVLPSQVGIEQLTTLINTAPAAVTRVLESTRRPTSGDALRTADASIAAIDEELEEKARLIQMQDRSWDDVRDRRAQFALETAAKILRRPLPGR